MGQSRFLTITLADEETLKRYSFRTRRWMLLSIVIVSATSIILSLILLITMAPIIGRAAEAGRLREENERLTQLRQDYATLESELREAQEFVARLAALAGVDYQYKEDTILGALSERPPSALSRSGEHIDYPSGLPVTGFISRGFLDENSGSHFAIDIACPEGTPVLVTASGIVESAVFDPVYGYMVTVRHSDSVKTVYAHNKEILVDPGQQVAVGSRIALSGNTGQSTAPHVHYEVLIHGKPINPMEGTHD